MAIRTQRDIFSYQDTQISDVLHEQTHGSRTAHSLCLLSTAIQSPGPRGGGRSEGVSGREATVSNSGGIRTNGHPEPSPRQGDGSSRACVGWALCCSVPCPLRCPPSDGSTGVSDVHVQRRRVPPPPRIMHAVCTQRS